MVTLTLTDEQVVDLINQLSPERKQGVVLALAEDAQGRRQDRMEYAEARLRRVCAERGRDWDKMDAQEREDFVDALVHEARS